MAVAPGATAVVVQVLEMAVDLAESVAAVARAEGSAGEADRPAAVALRVADSVAEALVDSAVEVPVAEALVDSAVEVPVAEVAVDSVAEVPETVAPTVGGATSFAHRWNGSEKSTVEPRTFARDLPDKALAIAPNQLLRIVSPTKNESRSICLPGTVNWTQTSTVRSDCTNG